MPPLWRKALFLIETSRELRHKSGANTKGTAMADLGYLALGLGMLALLALYAKALTRA
jgi:hypothetical protein